MEINWNNIHEEQINNLLDKILEEIKIDNNLTKYENRKQIYNHLIKTKLYDYEYFEGILKNYHEKDVKKRFARNPKKEFLSPLITNKGICNGFAQIYKLLLEKVGIYSICINCMIKHGNEFVGHQLNLVYDEESNTFSFDDVTFGIIKHTNEYFDYDNPEELEEMQGLKPIYKDIKWMILDEEVIYNFAKRENSLIRSPIKIKKINITSEEDFIENGITIKKYKKQTKTM